MGYRSFMMSRLTQGHLLAVAVVVLVVALVTLDFAARSEPKTDLQGENSMEPGISLPSDVAHRRTFPQRGHGDGASYSLIASGGLLSEQQMNNVRSVHGQNASHKPRCCCWTQPDVHVFDIYQTEQTQERKYKDGSLHLVKLAEQGGDDGVEIEYTIVEGDDPDNNPDHRTLQALFLPLSRLPIQSCAEKGKKAGPAMLGITVSSATDYSGTIEGWNCMYKRNSCGQMNLRMEVEGNLAQRCDPEGGGVDIDKKCMDISLDEWENIGAQGTPKKEEEERTESHAIGSSLGKVTAAFLLVHVSALLSS